MVEQYDSTPENVKTSIGVEHFGENEEEADEEEEEDKDEVQHSSDSTEPEQSDTVEGNTKIKYDEDTEKIMEGKLKNVIYTLNFSLLLTS